MIINQTIHIYPLISGLITALTAKASRFNMKKITSTIIVPVLAFAFVLGYGANVANAQIAGTATSVTCNRVVLQGDVSVSPPGTATNVWFQWGSSLNFENSTSQQMISSSGNFSQPVYNLSPNATYYYRAVANNASFGTVYGSVFSFNTPSCGNYNYGDGNYYANYNYGNYNYYNTSVARTLAVTNLPTSITQTSARLNGLVTLDNHTAVTSGWFEWGATQALGNTTQTRTAGNTSANAYSEYLTGLNPAATYYYRAVAQNQYGISKGDIQSFRTSDMIIQTVVAPSAPVTPAVESAVRTRAPLPQAPLIDLSMTTDNERVCRGDYVGFTVDYSNTSNQSLKDVVLRVSIPAELGFRDSSRGIFSEKDNTLTVEIGTLSPNEKGKVVVKVDVSSAFSEDKPLVTTSNMVYTTASGAQEEVVAYTLSKFACFANSQNPALAFYGGDFFPSTLIGWLALIVLLFVLVVLARSFYGTYAENREEKKEIKK